MPRPPQNPNQAVGGQGERRKTVQGTFTARVREMERTSPLLRRRGEGERELLPVGREGEGKRGKRDERKREEQKRKRERRGTPVCVCVCVCDLRTHVRFTERGVARLPLSRMMMSSLATKVKEMLMKTPRQGVGPRERGRGVSSRKHSCPLQKAQRMKLVRRYATGIVCPKPFS